MRVGEVRPFDTRNAPGVKVRMLTEVSQGRATVEFLADPGVTYRMRFLRPHGWILLERGAAA